MLYFKPVEAEDISPVPFTKPCEGHVMSTYVPPRNVRSIGHTEYYATITLHNVIIWDSGDYSREDPRPKMEEAMRRIASLARNDRGGIFDLM